jgi:hypothetical protein
VDRLGLAGVHPLGHGSTTANGAALTYARRYALFTLVGIAGEDDLDAPEIGGQPAEEIDWSGNRHDPKHRNGNGADQPLGRFAGSRTPWSPPKQPLEPEKSAGLRDRLLRELGSLNSQAQAAAWAQRAMAAKNTLTTGDCRLVETAFAARLAEPSGEGRPKLLRRPTQRMRRLQWPRPMEKKIAGASRH